MHNAIRQNAVFSLLEANKATELVLKDVYFVESDQQSLITLLEKIRKNTSVTSLVINSIGLNKNNISLVISSFKQRLQSIKILEEEFKGAGAEDIIVKKFTVLSNLAFLDLSGCKIGLEGCKGLNGLLEESETLIHLRLDNCGLDDSQLLKLFDSVNPKLKLLSLKRNAIGPQSVGVLKIPTLEELNISSNMLKIEGVRAILTYFTASSLLILDIKLNFINNDSMKIIVTEEFERLVTAFIKENKSRQITFYDLTEGANVQVSSLQAKIAELKGVIAGNVTLLGSVNLMQEYDGNQKH